MKLMQVSFLCWFDGDVFGTSPQIREIGHAETWWRPTCCIFRDELGYSFYLRGFNVFFFGCFYSVDTLAERIDSGIQQTVNPVVEQLSNKAHNVRESLGIWNRPFSPLSSGHPNPVAPPNTNVQSQSEGNFSNFPFSTYTVHLISKCLLGSNPFDLGLSPLFQSLFDSTPQREWWKG